MFQKWDIVAAKKEYNSSFIGPVIPTLYQVINPVPTMLGICLTEVFTGKTIFKLECDLYKVTIYICVED